MISLAGLIAAGIHPTQATSFLPYLLQVFDLRQINTLQRQSAFVAQASIESSGFTELEENLWYRDPARILKVFPREVPDLPTAKTLVGNPEGLARVVYANRNGNGNAASDDGWNYRGRGLFQLTGRANYLAAQIGCGEPYVAQPKLVAQPSDACLTAGWFWTSKGPCNALADKGDVDGITRIINGAGMAAAQARRDLYTRCMGAFR